MKSAFSIGKIFGVSIKIHFSWIFIFLFVVWSLMDDYFPVGIRVYPFVFYLLVSIVTSLLFFCSILLHEIAHSWVAKKCGVRVKSITLHIMGGVSSMNDNIPDAKKEFLISIVGPLTNIVLGIIFFAISIYSYGNQYWLSDMANWLGYINILTAVFNLLPVFPMDGGRVLRAIVWAQTKDEEKSTKLICVVGNVFGVVMLLLGALASFEFGLSLGIWCFVMAWLFFSSAKDMKAYVEQQTANNKYPISKYVHQNYITVMDFDKVSYVVKELQQHDTHQAILVVKDNHIVGSVDEKEIWQKQLENHDIKVCEIMHTIDRAHVMAEYDFNLIEAIFNTENISDLPVIADHRMIGFIARDTVKGIIE